MVVENKESIKDLTNLGSALKINEGASLLSKSSARKNEESPSPKPSLDRLGRAYATGKRKSAVARVWLKPGKGNIIVNDKPAHEYFRRPVLLMMIQQPFEVINSVGRYDILCTIKGSGLSGQAGALKHGISKALLAYDQGVRKELKQNGFLTRDSRRVERKKYGRAKARRSFQFSKR